MAVASEKPFCGVVRYEIGLDASKMINQCQEGPEFRSPGADTARVKQHVITHGTYTFSVTICKVCIIFIISE